MTWSPEDAVRLARESQQRLNAFTWIEDPDTLPAPSTGPLSGLPIAVKDLIDQAGRVTTCGSAFYRHHATRTATAISRIEAAGGTVIGRTGLHEFAFGFSSENPHFGPVRNPWDTDTSAGGSSGGSGAAVGAGVVPIAIGTDTGGSVRVPAALCGCFGLKVTHGAIPLDGVFPLVPSIDTVGPLADSVAHLELAYRAMADDEAPPPTTGRGLRFGIPQPWFDDAPVEDRVSAAFRAAGEALIAEGHEVHQILMPDVFPDRRVIHAIAPEVAAAHREFREEGREYGAEVEERLDGVFSVTEAEAAAGREWQQMIRHRFADAFATVDFIITPTVPAMTKVIGEDLIAGVHYRTVLSWFTSIVNHALLPAVSVPLTGSGRPPVSLQVIGSLGSDLALLSLGRELERAGVAAFSPAGSDSGNK